MPSLTNVTPIESFYRPPPPPPVIPLLTAQTDIGLMVAITSFMQQDIDVSKPAPRPVVSRVDARPLPAAASHTEPEALRHPSPPSTSTSTSRESSPLSSLDGDEDEDREEGVGDDGLDDGVMKIPKPAGEVGRPGRGGYSLDQVLQWPPIRIELLKVSCFCR